MSRSDRSDEAKKPYEPPVLVRWGTVQEITQAVGYKGSSDGGHKTYKRTGF